MNEYVEKEERRLTRIARKRELTYKDIEPIIECVVTVKCAKFGNIGIYNREDIAQEIRAKCYKILQRFDPNEGGAFNFFGSCADNLLRDLRRKHTLRKTNVCSRCVYYRNSACFLYADDQEKCRRFRVYLENKQRKESIAKMTCDPDFAWHTQPSDTFIFDQEHYYESAIHNIRGILPSGLVYSFDLLMAGSGIPKSTEEELFTEVKSAIQNDLDWEVGYHAL